ncbi:hypothetical protein LA080_003105 [Diaporthe eres]|nr:hypothetical protein LA080_003105 [Diaporthe eres]
MKAGDRPGGYGGIVPDGARVRDADGSLRKGKEKVNGLLRSYLRHLDAVELRAALLAVLKISEAGNELAHKASKLFKSDKEECGAFLHTCLNVIHLLATLLQPFLPDTAESIARQLGVDPVLAIPDIFDFDSIRPGHRLGEAEHLFTKIKPERAEDWKAQCGGSGSKRLASGGKGNKKGGRCSKKESGASGVSKSEESGGAKEPGGDQEEQPKPEASVLGGNAAVEDGLAQALGPLKFKSAPESPITWYLEYLSKATHLIQLQQPDPSLRTSTEIFRMSTSPESCNSPSPTQGPAPPLKMVGPGWTCCRCGTVTSLKWLDCEDRQCRHRRCMDVCRINKGPGFLRKVASALKARASKDYLSSCSLLFIIGAMILQPIERLDTPAALERQPLSLTQTQRSALDPLAYEKLLSHSWGMN